MEHTAETEVRWDVRVKDGIAVATAGDVVLVLWDAPSRAPRIRWIFDATEAQIRTIPEGVITLQLIRSTASPPDAEARAENARGLTRVGDRLRRLVTIPLGDDFWTTCVRTIMRGMFVLQGQSGRLVVSARVDMGITELLKAASSRTPSRRDIDSGVGQLFAAMGLPRER